MKHTLILAAAATTLLLTACSKKADTVDEVATTAPAQAKVESMVEQVVETATGMSDEEKATDDYVSYMTKLSSALEGVTDQESAEKAAATIREMTELMSKNQKEIGEGLSEEKMAKIMMSRQKEFAEIQKGITDQMMRISTTNPALIETLTEEMGKMNMN